jgi:signal transduction histidine kinase/FixJ family two-component response regulator
VLLVEDSTDDAALLMRELDRGGYTVECERVENAATMRAALEQRSWDLVLADYKLPHFSAPAALQVLHALKVDLPFIIVSGTVGEEAAVVAMKAGAHDYIAKDRLARLVPAIERELREAAVRRERQRAEQAQQEEAEISAALVQVGREMISSLDTPVLLDRLCQLTAEVVGCDCSHTLLLQPDEQVFVPVSSFGYSREEWEPIRVLRLPRDLIAGLLEYLRRRDVGSFDMAAFPDSPLAALALQYRVRYALTVALRRGDDVVGIHIAGNRDRQEPFTSKQKRLAQGIAQFASLALDHARLVEELERASRLKSDFVATMSHELRTPLNVIIGYLDLLVSGEFGALTLEEIDCLRRIDKSARELLDLINATLNLSRLEGGRLPLDLRDIDLAQLLAELDAETSELRNRPGLTFVWRTAPDLPILRTDPVKLKVIVKNLIANAVKFTAQGSVTVETQQCEGGVQVCVSDTGIGIPGEALNIIFEPFRQVDNSSTRRFGGVGLGLYIVRRLLDLLGGTVSVESEVGRGSTFRMWVPLSSTADAPVYEGNA